MKARWIIVLLVALVMALGGMNALAFYAPPDAPNPPGRVDEALHHILAQGQSSDLVVEFAEQADLSAAYSMDWASRGDYVVKTLQGVAKRSQAAAIAYLDARGVAHNTFLVGNMLHVKGGNQQIAEHLAALPGVARVRAPITIYLDPIINEAPIIQATTAWGITDTKANQFWSTFGVQGDGIVVSNIDTGVQWDHPALVNAYKCQSNPSSSACWSDPANICAGDNPCDNNGHGSHTMGTMVADDNPSLTYIAGMAPNAQWIACKGCESSSCSDASLNACADWLLAPGGSSANRPHVVNNSWGGGGGDTWYLSKVNAWRAAGIFPAFSAGNSGSSCSTIGSPGDYQESFASAAHSSSRTIASFSSRGPSTYGHTPYTKPNISAPGVSVCSTIPTNSWSCSYNGTSMASPHTAGAVALLWSCNSSLIGQIDQTFQILQDNADTAPAGNCGAPPDAEGNYTYGYGFLNILAAGNAWCGGTPPPTPTPTATAPTPTPTNTPTPAPVAPILLVDDDNGSSYQSYYTAALNALGKSYNTWTVQSQGSPSAATLQQYGIVIWFTGDDYTTTLTSTDQSNLTTYLNGGGKLFITGQDIGYDITGSSFYSSYLHASYVTDDTNTYGLTGYDILSGVNVNISGGDGANNQSYPSEISLGSDAVGLYDYDGSYGWGGLRWEGAYKVVYFSFGYEAINAAASRNSVMNAVLNWLEGGAPPPTPTNTPPPPPTNTPTNTPPPPPTNTPTQTPTPGPGASILLVDDDNGSSYQTYYTAALNALGKSYDIWTVQSQGSPSSTTLQQYDLVIWFTGDDYTTTLTSTDQSNLTTYLNGGGKLFITGQDIGYDITSSSFYSSYLHASYVRDDTNTYGLTGYDILSGVNVNISGGDGANNQSYPSEISLGSGAVGLYDYDGSYTWGGLRWAGAYKVVYFSFGYEAINAAASRSNVMNAVLNWLEGGAPPPTPTPTTPPGGEVFSDDFETNKGWTRNPSGSDTATTGLWERANPEGVDYNGAKQLDITHSGSYDLVTGPLAGSSAGSYDIDGGVTTIRSPNITLPGSGNLTLSFYYYLAHYSNSSSDDFLRVKVVGSTTQTVFEELGAANDDDAVWDYFSTSLNSFAGQTVYLLIEAADAGTASLVEAAVDDVLITVN